MQLRRSFTSAASSSRDELRPGGYAAGAFSYAFSPDWAAFAGAQFQDLGKYTHSEGGRQAEVYADATTVWPLLIKGVLEELGRK